MDADMMSSAKSDESVNPEQRISTRRPAVLGRIPVLIQVVLGGVTMPISEVSMVAPGSIIRLDKKIGEPVDILVNGKLFGRGEIAVLEGEEPRFAISMTEIVDLSEATSG